MLAPSRRSLLLIVVMGIALTGTSPATAQTEDGDWSDVGYVDEDLSSSEAGQQERGLIVVDPESPPGSPLGQQKYCIYKVTKILKKKNCSDCPSIGDRVYTPNRPCSKKSDCKKKLKGWLEGCHSSSKKCKLKGELLSCEVP